MPKLAKATEPSHQSHSDAHLSPSEVRVWDPLVRLFHWSLVLSFATAWMTANRYEDLHTYSGYVAGALIAVRLVWGLIGTRYARFVDFVKPPATVLHYLRDIAKGSEARYLGHNPAGGAMVLALLFAVATLVFTGWLMFTDTYYGDDTLAEVHGTIADGVLILIALHLAGVALASFRHHENLVRAMINGKKRGRDGQDAGLHPDLDASP